MHIERRRFMRRAITGGVLFAALSAVPLALIELLYVLLVRRPEFASAGEAWLFAGFLVLLLVSAGALLGVFEGLLVLAVSQLTSVVAKRRIAEPRWMAWIYSLLALPGIAVIAAKLFAGRRAAQLPFKDLIAVALGLLLLLATYAFLRLVIGARDRFRIRRWGPRHALLFAPALLAVATALYLADQRVLPNLYTFLHVALALGAVAFCQLAAGAIYAAYRPRTHWMGRIAEPSLALLLVLAAVAGAAWSLSSVGRSESLRYLYYQHTAVQAKVLDLAGRLKLLPEAPALAAAHSPLEQLPAQELLPGPRDAGASVFLISVDAMRADHMGAYGYSRPVTPQLDRWSASGAVVERAYCQVPHTSFSVTSLMTGAYVYALRNTPGAGALVTVGEVFKRYGYKTAAFFPPSVFYIDKDSFTAYEKSKYAFEYVKYEHLDAKGRIDQVLRFLEQEPGKVFVWLHLFEPHEPYQLHPGFDFGPRAMDRYDSELGYVDQQLGRLLEHIQAKRPRSYVALTADHGEEFGEHGAHYHGNALYDPQVRVPLILSGPGIDPRHIRGAAQVIDLPVTLLSLVDVPVPATMRGTDLGPWLAGEDPRRLPPVFTEIEQKKMVVHQDHKLLCDMQRDFCELYDLAADPAEAKNLIAKRPEVAGPLRQTLRAWLASHVQRGPKGGAEAEAAALLERGRQRDPGAVPGLMELASDGSLELRRQAMAVLAALRAPPARQLLESAADNPDPELSQQATVGAALLGSEPHLARLPSLLERSDLPPDLRRAALLAQASAGDLSAAAPLGALLRESEDIYQRIAIIEGLGELGDPAAATAVQGQLATLRTRLAAITALGQMKARSAVPELSKSLLEDRFTSWRAAAARSLGQIGAAQGVRALSRAVHTELEADVVAEAYAALGTLGRLPLPGLRPLAKTLAWRCGEGRCQLPLEATCQAVATKELLLWGRSTVQEQPEAAGASAPLLALHCGEKEVSSVRWPARGAVVLRTGADVKGSLRLTTAGDPPPELWRLDTRPLPARAP